MKRIRFTLAMMALVLFSITVNARHSSFEVDGICYRLTSRVYRTVSVTYRADTCEKYAGDIVIPTAISYKDSEYKVLGITEGAFSECTELLSVTIPDEIQNIGNGAFEGCIKLSAIRIPEGVPSIGESMFKQCENLESIYIPNSVTGIGASAFAHCYNLDSITIPNSITSIGASAFANCRELNSFTVPTSVTSIGEMAFHNCYNLESLKVAEGNTVFDSRNNCNAIIRTASNTLVSACPTTVIPHDITTIGPNAFRGMSITNLVFPDGLKAIGSQAFLGSSCDKTLIIPESVESIGQGAFAYCTADSVIICGQLTSLEEDVFEGCSNLIYIDLPGSLESVNAKSFNGSINLQKIVCRAPIPPQCNSQFFVFASEFITLEVPEESLPLYKEANLWKDFYRIKAIGSDDVVEQPDSNRNVIKKGHGTYRVGEDGECTYLVSYDYNAYAAKLDSVDCIQWHNRNAIVIDADTIGPEAFASCTFADGQIIYLTERVKVICKDAFSPIYIQRSTNDFQIAYNLYLVFEGKNPPRIADNRIMDYAKNPCDVNFVVPDLEAYIKSDAQWTYTTLMTVNDLLAGQVSEENTIKVLEAVEADVVVDFDKLAPSGAPMMYATVRPPKEVPVRIGTEGDTIYSPAPVWQNYKMQVLVVNDDGSQYFGGEWRCGADEQCNLTIELSNLPDSNYVYFLSRCIAPHAASSSWTRIKVQIRKEEPKTYLVTEGKEWQFRYFVAQYIRDVTYKLSGDTIIDGHTYKKEWVMGWNGSSQMELTQGFLREENGKVYRKEYNKEEYLWFDYNANIGDTIFYENSFVKVVGHSDTTIICNGVSRTYKGVDVQVGGYDVNISTPDSSTNYEHFLFPGYIATFYEELGLFTTGDIVRSPSFNMEGCVGYLLYVKQGDTILYQREEESPKEQSKFFADDTKWYGEEDYVYYSSHHRTSISYSLGTDTVIDGQLGQTLYRDGEYQGTFFVKGESVWFKPSTIFSWFINIEEEEELPTFLLYDFSLQVGDTIFYDERSLGYTYEKTEEYSPNPVVKAVREVHGRKVIDFDDGEQWIEGIGSIREPFLERWRPRLVGPGNTYESIYQVVADSATIWFKGELANPNIEPWIKTGMTWTENKQNNEGDEFVKRQIKVGAESLPGRFRISGSSPFSELQVINNKVYGSGMDNFILCYDFSLAKGDKVSLLNYYWYGIDNSTYKYDHCYVTNVDTVVYYGVPRKRVILSGDREDVWVEGIGSLTRVFPVDNVDGIQSHTAFFSELIECSYNGELLYRKNAPEMTRPTTKRGYGLYHSESYLYRYTINEAEAVTDSTDFARWYDKTVIYFDVDTIGPNAFSGATFRQGQILYFTERLNTIFKDAFTDVNIVPRTSKEMLVSDDLTLVFAGANPPGIDKNYIMDYADSTCHINYVVPDLETYIKDDIQWTYTTLMTIDDFVRGYISPENEVTVSDTTEADASVDNANAGEVGPTAPPTIRASVRPRGDIPVRIGEGENKDIYSRAPAWQYYTVEVVVTDCHADTLYTASQECRAHGQCDFVIELPYYPDGGYVYLHSRSIDMFGRATEWAVLKVQVDTAIDELLQSGTPNVYYDLQGRPVANPTRGIYIRNGRKVVL